MRTRASLSSRNESIGHELEQSLEEGSNPEGEPRRLRTGTWDRLRPQRKVSRQMSIKVADVPLSDSEIIAMTLGRKNVSVKISLWNEGSTTLEFENVSGLEAFAPVGEEISDCHEDAKHPMLSRCRAREADEAESAAMRCYVFRSATTDEPVLSIVAEGVHKRS